MASRVASLLKCELPIQLAPMGSVSGVNFIVGTRESSGTIAAMPFYAGQSAGATTRVEPAAAIVAELSRQVVDLL
jgi:hypothetical protein